MIVLSLYSLRNCTCGASSEPNAAVAMRQPLFGFSVGGGCALGIIAENSAVSGGIGWNNIPSTLTVI